MDKALAKLFDGPKIIILVSDINAGKSNLLYHIVDGLGQTADFSLWHYGLRSQNFAQGQEINSIPELESVTNSLVLLDEVMSLWDLDNRKQKNEVENTLRLIHHNNNILLLSMVPENIKKFIAAKASAYIFKKSTIPDFINGSVAKRVVQQYAGPEKGTSVLQVPIDKALAWDGMHYSLTHVPYMGDHDTKANNPSIFTPKE